MFIKRKCDTFISIAVLFCAIIILGAGIVLAESQSVENSEDATEVLCIPVGTVTIPSPEGVEPLRTAVEMPHGQHLSFACVECHHKWTGNNQFLTCGTAGCHDIIQSPIKTGNRAEAYRYYKNAFHDKCIGCHKSIKRSNDKITKSLKTVNEDLPPTGPTGCIGCHPKE